MASVYLFLIPLFLGGIFSAVGVGLLVFGLYQRKKAGATETWPTAGGSIVSARLDQNTGMDEDAYSSISFTPIVKYTYEIDGKTYQGYRVFPGASMNYDQNTAQRIINRYQPGATVTVHYDPANPTQAVLETKSKGGNLFLILGGVFAVLGILVCCIGAVMVVFSQA